MGATSSKLILAATAIALACGPSAATGDKAGRYTMNPAEGGGFVRLDTETGQMALCQRREGDWSCREMTEPAGGLNQEVDRLRAENQRLKAEIRQMEEIMLGDKRAEARPPGRPDGGLEFKLPSEQDVDAAMSYVQRMMRKFREKMKEIEQEIERDAALTTTMPPTPLSQALGRLAIDTRGEGLEEITRHAASWLSAQRCLDGLLTLFIRHTSASLTIQENADPDVRTDLVTALCRLAPEDAGWIHSTEGPDDMPAHVKTMLTGVNLAIPVEGGRMLLGTWQGIYLVEHRAQPHPREVALHFLGTTSR